MNTYLFKTSASMKEYNNKKWWIDSGIIREITVQADTITAALEEYRKTVYERDYIEISNNATKNPTPMYHDNEHGHVEQIGFVITAKTEFNENRTRWVTQYIDLWVKIYEIKNPFPEVI